MPRKPEDNPNKKPKPRTRKSGSPPKTASTKGSPSPASKSKSTGQDRIKRVSATGGQTIRPPSGSPVATSLSDEATPLPSGATTGPRGLAPGELYERIANRAYELYEQRGRTHGHDLEDWLRAEREILGEDVG